MTGVTALENIVTVGVGVPVASTLLAPESCANATVQLVAAVPGLRYPEASPPSPWYQTMSSRPAPPAAIHGMMSARPGSGVSPRLSVFTWYGFDQVAPPSRELATCTLKPSLQAAYRPPAASTAIAGKRRFSSRRLPGGVL